MEPSNSQENKKWIHRKTKTKSLNKKSENTITGNPENDKTMIEKQKCEKESQEPEKHQINQGQQQKQDWSKCVIPKRNNKLNLKSKTKINNKTTSTT